MRTAELKKYIEDRQHLFWYSPALKSETVSDDLLIETILNYGNMDDIRDLFSIMGIKNVAKIFFDSINLSERRKGNYHELTLNYFTLLFNRYANCGKPLVYWSIASLHNTNKIDEIIIATDSER